MKKRRGGGDDEISVVIRRFLNQHEGKTGAWLFDVEIPSELFTIFRHVWGMTAGQRQREMKQYEVMDIVPDGNPGTDDLRLGVVFTSSDVYQHQPGGRGAVQYPIATYRYRP